MNDINETIRRIQQANEALTAENARLRALLPERNATFGASAMAEAKGIAARGAFPCGTCSGTSYAGDGLPCPCRGSAVAAASAEVAPGSFRKKPVVIQAIQWNGCMDSLDAFDIPELHQSMGSQKVGIPTLEGTMIADVGDWIIRGVKGEFYPCKPDVFAMSYEPAATPAPQPTAAAVAQEIALCESANLILRADKPYIFRVRKGCAECERLNSVYSDAALASATLPVGALPAAVAQVAVPAGWKLVPVEPTDAMLRAIWGKSSRFDLPDAYAAMLAAAPTLSTAPDASVQPDGADKATDERALPPLPTPIVKLHDDGCFTWTDRQPHLSRYAGWKEGTFSEDQMTTYAREAVRAAISAAPVPDQQSKPDSRFDPMEEDDWDKLAELRSALEVVTRLPHTVFQFAILRIARLSSELAAASAVPAQADTWRPMETAPKDGTMLRLLVAFTDHQTEDTAEPCPTIGANSFDSTDIDQWQFAGWNWQQDCFTEGRGTPVGWLPLAPATPAVQGAETPKGGA